MTEKLFTGTLNKNQNKKQKTKYRVDRDDSLTSKRVTSSRKVKLHFILPVTIRKRFSLLQTTEDINFGLVRMYVTPYRIFWIIFTSDLVISYTDKLLVFRLVQIVLLL